MTENVEDLFHVELKDVYDAEKRLVKALPKMAKAAESQKLRSAIEEHLQATHGHVKRLEQIFEWLGQKPTAKTCDGMKGLNYRRRKGNIRTSERTVSRPDDHWRSTPDRAL